MKRYLEITYFKGRGNAAPIPVEGGSPFVTETQIIDGGSPYTMSTERYDGGTPT